MNIFQPYVHYGRPDETSVLETFEFSRFANFYGYFRIDIATLQNELPDVDFSQINGDSVDFSDSAQVEQLAQALEGVDFEQLMTNFARLFHLCAKTPLH